MKCKYCDFIPSKWRPKKSLATHIWRMHGSRVTATDKIKEFEEKFGKRLDMLESFYYHHGGEQWTGETIPEWLAKALKDEYNRGRKSIKGVI